jgi:hypothetical protein
LGIKRSNINYQCSRASEHSVCTAVKDRGVLAIVREEEGPAQAKDDENNIASANCWKPF